MTVAIEEVKKALQFAGYEPRRYSGRGMFGKECLGVSVNQPGEIFRLGGILAEHVEDMGPPQFDSLGYDWIVYWREVPYE